MAKKLVLFLFIITLISMSVFAQQMFLLPENLSKNATEREIKISSNGESIIEYYFQNPAIMYRNENNEHYAVLNIKDFSHLKSLGKPALPASNNIVLVPHNAEVEVEIIEADFVTIKDVLVMPALRFATDRYGDPEPEFFIDAEFYRTNTSYPQNPVEIIDYQIMSGNRMAFIQLCPFEYNAVEKELKFYTYIKYKISFGNKSIVIDKSTPVSSLKTIENIVLNNQIVSEEIVRREANPVVYRSGNEAKNYLIITHSKYQKAADSLAQWKQQLGYSVEIISRPSWTSSQVKKEIAERYKNYNPKPEYFVIIGDNEDVPGENLYAPTSAKFASDRYYACFDGSGDYLPDIAHGRISVNSASNADAVVKKIINYERFPITDTNFYKTGLNCAQFQDDDRNGYADRRFAQTSEEIKNYVEKNTNISVKRVYATDAAVNPTNWNYGMFSAGEPIDASLKKPGFPWNGGQNDIANEINNGVFYVLHRDHGYAGGTGWHMPAFSRTDVKNLLNNGDKLPVVFSINCHTGEFQVSECFAEAFLRHTNGGAVGVVGAAYYSYSGLNDAFSMGMFDAIWSNPGFVPKFSGSGGIKNPDLKPHNDILQMGNVMIHGLLRMVETWGTDKYTFELYHYFGDPAMRIWKSQPQKILFATHEDTIICNSTAFEVKNCSLKDGLVTLVADGEFVAKAILVDGKCTLSFPPLAAQNAILTISKENYAPYLFSIPVVGGCPKAKFIVGTEVPCVENQITFTNKSSGTIITYSWEFGNDALPSTASGAGPHKVLFALGGEKNIKLTVDGSAGKSTYESKVFVDDICRFNSTTSGSLTIKNCTGYLYDNGGNGAYTNSTDGRVIISPPGAKNVNLQFLKFDFEVGKDSIIIYDGATITSPVIGSFSGNNLPNGGKISSSGASVLIRQRTNSSIQKEGYELFYYCDQDNKAPEANFIVSSEESCSGYLKLTDVTRNKPDKWYWNFGDSKTSVEQSPLHLYHVNGEFDIQLIAENAFGKDTVLKSKVVKVAFPEPPVVYDAFSCNKGQAILKAECIGSPEWYDSLTGGSFLGKGRRFTTPVVDTFTTFYVQRNASIFYAGIENPSGNGSYYNSTSESGLIFNVFKPIRLNSVLVNSSISKERTITLKNSAGTTLMSKKVIIPTGTSRVELNFDILPGEDYKLILSANASLFRHYTGAVYPYEIPGIISIIGNTLASFGYYYYLYDWELTDYDSCRSIRVPANVRINNGPPVADFSVSDSGLYYKFTNLSSNYNKYVWALGDGTVDTVRFNISHKYSKTGSINVTLGTYNACGSNFKYETINVVNRIENKNDDRQVIVYPNPSSGSLSVINLDKGAYSVLLYDITGKIIDNKSIEVTVNSINMNLPGLSDGLYYLHLKKDNEMYVFKILIQK